MNIRFFETALINSHFSLIGLQKSFSSKYLFHQNMDLGVTLTFELDTSHSDCPTLFSGIGQYFRVFLEVLRPPLIQG